MQGRGDVPQEVEARHEERRQKESCEDYGPERCRLDKLRRRRRKMNFIVNSTLLLLRRLKSTEAETRPSSSKTIFLGLGPVSDVVASTLRLDFNRNLHFWLVFRPRT